MFGAQCLEELNRSQSQEHPKAVSSRVVSHARRIIHWPSDKRSLQRTLTTSSSSLSVEVCEIRDWALRRLAGSFAEKEVRILGRSVRWLDRRSILAFFIGGSWLAESRRSSSGRLARLLKRPSLSSLRSPAVDWGFGGDLAVLEDLLVLARVKA